MVDIRQDMTATVTCMSDIKTNTGCDGITNHKINGVTEEERKKLEITPGINKFMRHTRHASPQCLASLALRCRLAVPQKSH